MHSGRANCNWIYNWVGFRTEGFIIEVSLYMVPRILISNIWVILWNHTMSYIRSNMAHRIRELVESYQLAFFILFIFVLFFTWSMSSTMAWKWCGTTFASGMKNLKKLAEVKETREKGKGKRGGRKQSTISSSRITAKPWRRARSGISTKCRH